MKIVRFSAGGEAQYGVLEAGIVRAIRPPFEGIGYTGAQYPLETVSLLAPAVPEKILAVGLNYVSHAKEIGMELPKEPMFFLKPPSAILSPGGVVVRPRQSQRVDYEAELAVVVGREGKRIPEEQAAEYILGYTCLNDVTARDLQFQDSQWSRAKGFDTFCPLGPWIETDYDWHGKRITARLNGEVKQDATTDDFIHPVERLVAYLSTVMTLKPGDVIATGTSGGIGPMAAGDTIEIEIEGIGVLRNGIADEL